MTIFDGILSSAKQLASTHFNQRPSGADISLLVIHNISLPPGQFGGKYVEKFFLGKLNIADDESFRDIANLKVSAHLVIKRDGQVLQFVNFNDRAWHAGVSNFAGRENCNDFSIGIELEGTDDIDYTDHQYRQLSLITKLLMIAYPKIARDRICGHCDIAPTRKTDPGASFDWKRYKQSL